MDSYDLELLDDPMGFQQRLSLHRHLRNAAVLLLCVAVLPVAQYEDAKVFIFERAKATTGFDLVRLFWPAVLAALLIGLRLLKKLDDRLRSWIFCALIMSLPLAGPSPLSLFESAKPPLAGSLVEGHFGIASGGFFPREGALHLTLLGCALILLAAGSRYRCDLQSSRLGPALLAAGMALTVAYYVAPYEKAGERPTVAAIRNVKLYQEFYEFASKQARDFEALAAEYEGMAEAADQKSAAAKMVKGAEGAARMIGQVKFSSYYYLSIYFLPLLFGLLAIPALFRPRHLGHRAAIARVVGTAATFYLFAFITPLALKDSGGEAGRGFLVALREIALLGAFLPAAAWALASAIRWAVEPNATDDALAPEPELYD